MNYAQILNEAHAAAKAAQAGMVEGRGLDCGFAWVVVDGTDGLARYCRAEIKRQGGERQASRDLGSKGYPTGWRFWKPGDCAGQSIGIHEAGAKAFRDVLASYGIRADVGSCYD